MGKEKIILILALFTIVIGGTSTAYVYMTQIDKDTITINREEYTINQIFYLGETKKIKTIEGIKPQINVSSFLDIFKMSHSINFSIIE